MQFLPSFFVLLYYRKELCVAILHEILRMYANIYECMQICMLADMNENFLLIPYGEMLIY